MDETETIIPEWVVLLIGKQALENEALRRELAARDQLLPCRSTMAAQGAEEKLVPVEGAD